MANPLEPPPLAPWREKLRVIIFEADTPAGQAFDIGLLVAILLSVLAVMLDSVNAFRIQHGPLLTIAEWAFTLLFSVEYGLRLICSPCPLR
jgi:voltage-gated potassium channel